MSPAIIKSGCLGIFKVHDGLEHEVLSEREGPFAFIRLYVKTLFPPFGGLSTSKMWAVASVITVIYQCNDAILPPSAGIYKI